MNLNRRGDRRVLGWLYARRRFGILVSIVCAALIAFILAATEVRPRLAGLSQFDDAVLGEPAPRDLFADRSLTYVDEQATELRRHAVAQLVPVAYIVSPAIAERNIELFDRFTKSLVESLEASKTITQLQLELQAALPGIATPLLVSAIVESQSVFQVLGAARSILERSYQIGVIERETDSRTEIALHRVDQSGATVVSVVPVDAVATLDRFDLLIVEARADGDGRATGEARGGPDGVTTTESTDEPAAVAAAETKDEFNGDEIQNRAILALLRTFLKANAFVDAQLTEQAQRVALRNVEPVGTTIIEGERIVRAGDIVTADDIMRIQIVTESSVTRNSSRLFGTILLVICVVMILLIRDSDTPIDWTDALVISGATVVFGLSVFVVVRFAAIPEFVPIASIMPTALLAMLVSILVHPRVAIAFVIGASIVVLAGTGFDSAEALVTLLFGFAATFIVRGAERRIDLIRAGLKLALAQAAIVTVVSVLESSSVSHLLIAATWASGTAIVTGVLNLGVLPYLEHLTNAATPFRLLELSDLNTPILKRMSTLAPGTYGHTVTVANLAEAACREIGANALLARVGAYYHDIGKIDQAEYFIENQTGTNKHDEMKPSLSAAVIRSHVKIGIEKAREFNLPRDVISMIEQHHGTQLIRYFYAQALRNGAAVNTNDYSYSGTPPISKEAAVIMLADAVEATSRVVKRPNVAKLEKLVWKLIVDRFSADQMSNSELTLRDLDIIKKSFVHILAGQFHSRIEYPEEGRQTDQDRGAS